MKNTQRWMQADGHSAGLALYKSLYEEGIHRLRSSMVFPLPTKLVRNTFMTRYLDIP